uniref:Endoplasmic reticulum membrane sensor NFE2L1 n=1 Tax=Astyanax mexicanus TaxID=7994 RepID=A0A8B9H6Q9_ASTMX
MQSLKKYFTEGLIQVAILLSLAGIRVDVDPYLPPLAEIIQGQSSALTQTQFHNLQNSLDGYSHHLKSVDLDGFFTTRRLLRWVRSLDHLQVPAAQLETWLVHREPENSVTVIPGQSGALDGADGNQMDNEDIKEVRVTYQSQETREREHMGNSTHQDLSLHQTHQSDQNHNVSNSSNTDFHFNDSDIINFLLSPPPEGSVHNNHSLPSSPLEEQNLPSLFDPLLEDAMFEEISLLDLALEEGFNSSQVSQSEEQEQTDSDSGLSLDFSQSPASPSGSESSYSTLEEGAVGYVQIKEEPTDEEEEEEEEEGAASQFHNLPWLQQIDHDHTYNQPQCTIQRKSPKQRSDELLEDKIQEKFTSRDEKRALSLKIPFSTDCIINLPVEEFNELLGKYHLSEAQLTLIRDIRRRGKNKMAAQNCRRRKLDVLVGLERSVDGLRRHRARLLREKSEVMRSVQEMKQRLNDLYQEVYGLLREEQGMLCSANDFLLEQENSSQGPLSTRYSSESRRKSGSKRYKKD